jgi:hypothetical protein
MTGLQFFIGLILVLIGAIFVYVQTVVLEETKQRKRIPLIWEKDFWNKP